MANNPTGIRYDKVKVDFIKEKEKLKSIQQVVNFLVDQYYWHNKPLPQTSALISSVQQLRGNILVNSTSNVKSFQDYMNQIPELLYEDEFRKLRAEIESNEVLTKKQKDLLILNMAKTNL